jgi:hypothetical protein
LSGKIKFVVSICTLIYEAQFLGAANLKRAEQHSNSGTVSVFETALPGEAAEKSGLSIGYSLPYGESQALLVRHKWPIKAPNGAI